MSKSRERFGQRKGHHGRGRVHEEQEQQIVENVDENSPVLIRFKEFAAQIDEKNDRYERLVKLSRDITIESKRIIFLLHSIDKGSKRESVLTEAQTRINKLNTTLFKTIAMELQGQDPYQFRRAFCAGLEEYIEAVTFLFYLRDKSLPHWNVLQNELCYDEAKVNLFPLQFFLGVGDLTGELMRCCIQSLGTGSTKSCYEVCAFVRDIYVGYMSINHGGQSEFNRKMYTMRQSLTKMENACYTLAVRGNEMPKHMLADVFNSEPHEDGGDEGYCV